MNIKKNEPGHTPAAAFHNYPGLLLVSLFFLLQLSPNCSNHRQPIVTTPLNGTAYHSLNLKVRLQDRHSGRKQGMKILVKFDNTKARMLFLGPPLNKIYAKLLVHDESALLINTKKKKYWRGTFKTLLKDMWGVDFTYQDFILLCQEGTIPHKKIKKSGFQVALENDPQTNQPAHITITTTDLAIDLNVLNRRTNPGTVISAKHVNLGTLTRSSLDDLLADD